MPPRKNIPLDDDLGIGGMAESQGDEAFRWDALVPLFIHPLKVAIIEALVWVKRPLSPIQIAHLFGGTVHLGLISYHVGKLDDLNVLELVGEAPVRGAVEHFYALSHPDPSS